jgi:hypothetical protein
MPDITRQILRLTAALLLALLCACAQTVPRPAAPLPSDPHVLQEGLFNFSSEDTDCFARGLDFLENEGAAPEGGKAREAFAELLAKYPRSKWQKAAAALIRLLDERARLREGRAQDGQALEKARGETEQLRKELRALNDRLQTETSRLAQENEQLKKDLQLLKELELQLDKRDRNLR